MPSVVLPSLILALIVAAASVQTEAASYLSTVQAYDRPYLMFYLTHSSFALVFPAHVAVLYLVDRARLPAHLAQLRHVLAAQIEAAPPLHARPRTRPAALLSRLPSHAHAPARPAAGSPLRAWAPRIALLTLLISAPALSWYVAMALAPAMEVTALYATSAFHAYFFSMALLAAPLSRTTIASIAVAFAGVVVMTLGAARGGSGGEGGGAEDTQWAGRLTGDAVMAVGAAMLGLYEVVYKILLPSSPAPAARLAEVFALGADRVGGASAPLLKPGDGDSDNDGDGDGDHDGRWADETRGDRRAYGGAREPASPTAPHVHVRSPALPLGASGVPAPTSTPPLPAALSGSAAGAASASTPPHPAPALPLPPPLPPALHANFLTSCIGLATALLLWAPVPLLHWTGLERFTVPRGAQWASMAAVCVGGSTYNAGLMVLIGLWGPTTSSVANLLTIGLVALADAALLGAWPAPHTLAGALLICAGFGALLYAGDE
ncbi:hypothetical protein Q5752_000603 [Cryptotrichosporon argae]